MKHKFQFDFWLDENSSVVVKVLFDIAKEEAEMLDIIIPMGLAGKFHNLKSVSARVEAAIIFECEKFMAQHQKKAA